MWALVWGQGLSRKALEKEVFELDLGRISSSSQEVEEERKVLLAKRKAM